MHQLDTLSVTAGPYRKRATDSGKAVVPQFSRQDDFRNAPHDSRVKRSLLFGDAGGLRRPRWTRADAKAECGTNPAQPADKGATGEHSAECTGRGRSHKAKKSKFKSKFEVHPFELGLELGLGLCPQTLTCTRATEVRRRHHSLMEH